MGLSRWLSGKESACQCRWHRRCRFNSWVSKIPLRRKWQPIPVFLPGKFHGQSSLASYILCSNKELNMTEWLSTHTEDRVGIPWWLSGEESLCTRGDMGYSSSILGLGTSLRGGNGNLLQYSCLENSIDREAWWATVHRAAKSQIWLSNWAQMHTPNIWYTRKLRSFHYTIIIRSRKVSLFDRVYRWNSNVREKYQALTWFLESYIATECSFGNQINLTEWNGMVCFQSLGMEKRPSYV